MELEVLISELRRRRLDAKRRIDMTRVPLPPLFEVVTADAVAVAQESLGRELPQLLHRIYMDVGNGGFGPGAGLLGLPGGNPDPDGRTLVERYRWLVAQRWPVTILPMNDWGAGVWSCVDGADPAGAVITSDHTGFVRTEFTLRSWFEAWLSGADLLRELFEFGEATILNPFTRKPMSVKRRVSAKGTRLDL
jgi:hypothetical protein